MSAGESLLLGNGQQLALVEIDELGLPASAYEEQESRGRFTGDRIFAGNPKLYHAIAALLGRSVPYREIAEICSVSVNTVCNVAQREGIPIETIRERIARLGFDVAGLSMEAIRDLLADPIARKKIGAKDLAIIHGIAAQNAQLFAGGATARIESVERAPKPGHDDYLEFLKNVTPTGSSVEIPPAKERAADVLTMPGTTSPTETTNPTT